ncbi:MAG: hypothetical protein U0411_14025 [Thermodesulfovibrionales bacterium]
MTPISAKISISWTLPMSRGSRVTQDDACDKEPDNGRDLQLAQRKHHEGGDRKDDEQRFQKFKFHEGYRSIKLFLFRGLASDAPDGAK